MKLLVTGAAGLLGQHVTATAVSAGHEALPLDLVDGVVTAAGPTRRIDLTDQGDVQRALESETPDWVINTAAWTAVDDSEEHRSRAWAVNVDGVSHLLLAAGATGSRVCTLSTDYVFDGLAGPYAEEDERNPLGWYGRTKAAMEDLVAADSGDHLVVRTMVLYGAAEGVRSNFGLWLVSELGAGRPIRVVTDQVGNPTLASDLARILVAMLEQGGSGLYHAAGGDLVSRHEFAHALAGRFGLDEGLIEPATTAELGQAADRPLSSGFIMDRLRTDLGIEPAGLQESLERFRAEVEQSGGMS